MVSTELGLNVTCLLKEELDLQFISFSIKYDIILPYKFLLFQQCFCLFLLHQAMRFMLNLGHCFTPSVRGLVQDKRGQRANQSLLGFMVPAWLLIWT